MTNLRTLVIGTRNPKKLTEIRRLLRGLPVLLKTVADFPGAGDVEETGATFRDNAARKATETARAIGEWVVADDSGLEVDALGGAPGVFSARYAGPEQDDERNIARLLRELRDVAPDRRTARFRCVIALAAPDRLLFTAEGVCEGGILFAPRGEGGFGYDPVFVPRGRDRTFAELGAREKDALSHRGKALRMFRDELSKLL